VVNLGELERRYQDGETVNIATLKQKGLIKGAVPVKILGDGKFTKKLIFKISTLSASAKAKIEQATGSIRSVDT
jgi:large subunit ribosomal protein L15